MTELALGGSSRIDGVATIAAAETSLAARPSRRPFAALSFRARIGTAAALTALAYFVVFTQVMADAFAGSRAAFLVVLPVLLILITTGYRVPPSGVSDTESDWIITAIVGAVAFTGIHLLSERMPTLAGFWRVQLLGIVVWFACSLAVLFGIRHVVRMWAPWTFAVCCATPVPFLLTTAALGGSDTGAALLAAALGAVAVFLATRGVPLRKRAIAAAGSLVIAAAFVQTLGGHAGLLATTVVAAGVVPVLAVIASTRRDEVKPATTSEIPRLPRTSPVSLIALAVIAGALFAQNPPVIDSPPIASAADDWAAGAGLDGPTPYPFITRFLGSDATLVRLRVPPTPGLPAAAVDVMTAPDRAVLDDYADAVWYPTTRSIDYHPAAASEGMPLGASVIHSNADAATDDTGNDWYAVTWLWRTSDAFQRITVIVSQSIGADRSPPPPAPLSFLDASLRPAMWIARQQPDVSGSVDELVTLRAADVVKRLTASGSDTGAPAGA